VLSGTANGRENGTAEPLPINGNNLEDSKTRSNLLEVTESKFRQMKETQEDTVKENAVLEDKLIHSERLAMVGRACVCVFVLG